MDTERKIYGLLETVEQQQKNLNIAAAALEATRQAIAGLIGDVQKASAAGASAGAAQALAQAGLLVTEAAGPTIAELKQATASVAQVQSTLRRATAWVSWQYLALIAAGCAALVLASGLRSLGSGGNSASSKIKRPRSRRKYRLCRRRWTSSQRRAGRSNSAPAVKTNASASRSTSAWGPSARRARVT